jgi:hypothetical protein
MKTLDEAAIEYARNHSKAPDKETPDWIIADFKAGAEYACQQNAELKAENERLSEALTKIFKLFQKTMNPIGV